MTRVWLIFAAGTIGIAFAGIFVRFALPAPPVVMGFYRMLFASILLLGIEVVRRSGGRGYSPSISRRGILLSIGAGACFGGDLSLWNTAIVETSVANATLLVNTTPITVGLFAHFYLGQRLGWHFFLGTGLALVGCGLLVGVGLEQEGEWLGEALALIAALFYTGYILTMKAARSELDAGSAVLIATLSAAVVMGGVGLWLGNPFSGFPMRSWLAIVGAAVVSQVMGVYAIAWSIRYLRATFVSVGLLAQPLGTAILGWLLLGEAIGVVQGAGGMLLLAGIWIVSQEAREAG